MDIWPQMVNALSRWHHTWVPDAAFASVIIALHLPVHASSKYAAGRPHLFVLLLLLSLAWGVLIPYYLPAALWPRDELLPAISSFLIYVFGHQLRREATGQEFEMDGWDHVAIWLYLFLFIPGLFQAIFVHELKGFDSRIFTSVCSTIAALCAFVALYRGLREWDRVHSEPSDGRSPAVARTPLVGVAGGLMVLYFVLEVVFAVVMDSRRSTLGPQLSTDGGPPDALLVGFAALKLCLVFTAVAIVGRHTAAGRGSAWRALLSIAKWG